LLQPRSARGSSEVCGSAGGGHIIHCEDLRMKGLNQKKSDKKKPAKTMKEKKAEKSAKKAAKGR